MNSLNQNQPPRSTKKILTDRINYAYELLMNDIPSPEIKRILVEKFDVNIRTADRYVYTAFRLLEDKNEMSRKRKLAWYKARKIRLLRDMDPKEKKSAAGVRAIDGVLNSLAKMEGVLVDKLDVTSGGEKIQTIIKTSDGTTVII